MAQTSDTNKNSPHRIPTINGRRAPATSHPYQPGDDVPVYVSETGPDSEHHGKKAPPRTSYRTLSETKLGANRTPIAITSKLMVRK
jgi:hypothetical protein